MFLRTVRKEICSKSGSARSSSVLYSCNSSGMGRHNSYPSFMQSVCTPGNSFAESIRSRQKFRKSTRGGSLEAVVKANSIEDVVYRDACRPESRLSIHLVYRIAIYSHLRKNGYRPITLDNRWSRPDRRSNRIVPISVSGFLGTYRNISWISSMWMRSDNLSLKSIYNIESYIFRSFMP